MQVPGYYITIYLAKYLFIFFIIIILADNVSDKCQLIRSNFQDTRDDHA